MSFSAAKLVAARRRAGLTQVQLAEAAGIALSALTLYEIGQSWPKPINLHRLVEVLGVDPRSLYTPLAPGASPAEQAKWERKAAGMTQADWAKKLGISVAEVRRRETESS